jgi:hypothetical protein
MQARNWPYPRKGVFIGFLCDGDILMSEGYPNRTPCDGLSVAHGPVIKLNDMLT